jgi:hypothetical protein
VTSPSEAEHVTVWRDIARILFCEEIQPRIGELGSQSTRAERVKVEELFNGAQSNVKSRKIDLFFQKTLPGYDKPLELCSWEAKAVMVGPEMLQIQRRKNIRINACIANKLFPIVNAADNNDVSSQISPMILDIEGYRALPYVVKMIKPGKIFGVGAVTSPLSMICLPQTEQEINDFLDEGHLSALLVIKVEQWYL